MKRLFLLLALLAAAPASAQTTAVDLDTRIASLQTQLEVPDLPRAMRDSLESLLTRTRRLADAARQADAAAPAPARAAPVVRRPSAVVHDSVGVGESPRIMSPLVLSMFVALGAILVGVGLWVMWQRKRQTVVGLSPLVAHRAPLTGAQQQQRHAALGGRPLYASQGAVEALEQQVQTLRKDLDEARAWITEHHRSQQAAAIAAPAPTPTVSAPAGTPADAAAAAFSDWCRRATPMMGKVDFFGNALSASVPGARVQTVFRDLNSQAEPIRFDARGGASPAEFWLVTVGGDALLFPQPLTATQFRDLARVFDGTATPQALGQITPARVRDEGGTFALVQPGRMS